MTDWVYPLGTAADAANGTSRSEPPTPSRAVDGWAHTGLKVATLAAGRRRRPSRRRRGTHSGAAQRSLHRHRWTAPGYPLERAGPSVFSRAHATSSTRAPARAVTISSCRRRPGRRRHRPGARLLPHPPRHRGGDTRWSSAAPGNCSRQVHNFGTPAALEADRFIVCEVPHPGRQLVLLSPAQARRGEGLARPTSRRSTATCTGPAWRPASRPPFRRSSVPRRRPRSRLRWRTRPKRWGRRFPP
jgi:5-deoxy-glucuronate isomerase